MSSFKLLFIELIRPTQIVKNSHNALIGILKTLNWNKGNFLSILEGLRTNVGSKFCCTTPLMDEMNQSGFKIFIAAYIVD